MCRSVGPKEDWFEIDECVVLFSDRFMQSGQRHAALRVYSILNQCWGHDPDAAIAGIHTAPWAMNDTAPADSCITPRLSLTAAPGLT